MKRLRVFVPFMLIIMIGLIAMPDRYRTARQDVGSKLGFPFEVILEERQCCFGPPTWKASVEVPKPYFSRENLDQLFRFFSLRHPNMQERLYVEVYTGKLNRSEELHNYPISVPWIPKDGEGLHAEPEVVRWDAMFTRTDGFDLPGRNESYIYRPNLDNPDEVRVVILKGTLILRPKKIVGIWITSKRGIKVRVIGYYLQGVEPRGVYYTFQSPEADSTEWQSIMTSRQDEKVPNPADSVVCVTDSIAYAMMGSMYAVTADGGMTWSVWDAERDFEAGRWSDHWIIRQVEMTGSGDGIMRLTSSAQWSQTSVLHTSDFGKHWNSE